MGFVVLAVGTPERVEEMGMGGKGFNQVKVSEGIIRVGWIHIHIYIHNSRAII